MDQFLLAVGQYLIERGDFAVIAGVEGIVIWRLGGLLLGRMELRITERSAGERAAYSAMAERTQELERLTSSLSQRRRT